MPFSTDMIVRVAHADIAMHMAFPRSVAHWNREHDEQHPWKTLPAHCRSILIGKNDGVLIDGNCSNGVSAPEGGLIHICGDLASRIDADGHYEIVVSGDVKEGATIDASGFCHMFVAGDFSGELRSTDSAKVWIGSNFNGTVKTGAPSTAMYIGGDYNGNVMPKKTAALLWLTVAGFATQASLSKIVGCEYTQFNASIARSDVAAGLYPLDGHHRKTPHGNSFNRWCVQAENGK